MSTRHIDTDRASERLDDLSIVVLSYNRRCELLQNLVALCDLHVTAGAELIIVDNYSSDGTQAELEDLGTRVPTLKLIFLGSNLGVAGGRNAGWEAATRRFILNLDDDTRIDLAAIRALRAAALQMPRAGIFTPKVIHAITSARQNGYGDNVTEPANFHGACHLVRADVWQAVGPIDSQCTFGGEELDYSIRARCLGYCTIFLPNVQVRHNSLPRTGALGRLRRQRWVYNFSRIFFKHFPIRYATLFLVRCLASQVASSASAGDLAAIPSLFYHSMSGMVIGRRD
jgi:GT2 family glycosyltransferase